MRSIFLVARVIELFLRLAENEDSEAIEILEEIEYYE